MPFGFRRFVSLVCLLAAAVFAAAPRTARAESEDQSSSPRYIFYVPASRSGPDLQRDQLVAAARTALDLTYEDIAHTFMLRPRHSTVVRFLAPQDFHRKTGAPDWTSAMFLHGEITIPIRNQAAADIQRAVRHEYVHAAVSEFSGRRCPAWLDEGLAQIFEGTPNPILGPSLRDWTAHNEALPLDWLEGGFMSLNGELVPVAYAQSLFATKLLVQNLGYSAISKYLSLLQHGENEKAAFRTAFLVDQSTFQQNLTSRMREWAESGKVDP